ncbi:hypothetical protein SKAU_G00428920 [Synaphobranchus kaupii]|uniref:Zona pellucida sperm-binding protein 4 n=1 Tax=Synaphobranchus kaupii TaxID=118154 RepID=A0A9Q1E4I5_SYNKA|nr:hypothetical protein SKAU_G00428920 [Synaphobranchus kaupii]
MRCAVGDFARVLCGEPAITPEDCEALNCCFDQQCYYANEVTVHCLRDGQFKVVVSRASTLPPLDLGSVNLLEGPSGGSCGPFVASPAFEVFQFPVSTCGTTVQVEGDYVIYDNKMSAKYDVATGSLGSITRDSVFELSFQCRYHGSAVVSLVAEVNTVPPPLPVAAAGPLRVELRLASGQCDSKGAKGCADADVYSDYYRDADYPVTKVLREPVYVEVRILERTDPNLVLLLEHCWATSTLSPFSLPQWSLLVDGCPYHADPYLTTLVPVDGSSGLPFPTHYKRFMVQMFTFVDPASSVPLNEMVFIHCSTEVCHPSDTDRCEQRCSGKQRRSLVPVGKRSTEDKVLVSSKALILTNPEPPASGQSLQSEVPQSLGYGLLGVAACVLLLSTLALAVACTKPSRMEPKDQSKYFGSKDGAFHRCAVGDFARVLCGEPAITPEDCEALNCCFDQQCYYANEVTVHCLRDGQFKVVVSRASTLPPLDLGSVNLLEGPSGGSCGPFVASPAFEVFQFPVSTCGTTVQVEGDYVIYDNKMSAKYDVATGSLGSITRDSVFELSFQCRYHGSAVVSLVAEVNTVPPPLPVAAAGPLRVELRLASGQCDSKGAKGCADADVYSDYYRDADYPVTKVLREPVYVEVRILERTDPNLVLLLEHCWATATSSPFSLPQWSLLVDGCPYHADPYLTTLVPVDGSSGLPFPTHYKRFMVQMFTFVDPASSVPLNEMVFIHCSTEVCHPSDTDRCEQRCSGKQRRSLVPVGKRSTEDKVLVSSKALILTNPEPPASGQRLHGEVPQSLGYSLLGVAACVLLLSTLALAVACTKPSRMEPKV